MRKQVARPSPKRKKYTFYPEADYVAGIDLNRYHRGAENDVHLECKQKSSSSEKRGGKEDETSHLDEQDQMQMSVDIATDEDAKGQKLFSPSRRSVLWQCGSCKQLQLSAKPKHSSCTHCIKSKTVRQDTKEFVARAIISSSTVESDGLTIVKPQVNDVLIGKGPHIFNHVGNRRFRVLVEANFDRYFDINGSELARETIAKNIVNSIHCNTPKGRFLVPVFSSDADAAKSTSFTALGAKDTATTECEELSANLIMWKEASQEKAIAKVRSAFLAAGCFLVSKAALLEELEKTETQTAKKEITNEQGGTKKEGDNGHVSIYSGGRRSPSPKSDSSDSILFKEDAHPPTDQRTTLAAPIKKCPNRLKQFIHKPISNYFVLDSPSSEPSPYIVPSNYDILCGQGQQFFHHIGNRRFRISIEANVHVYQSLISSHGEEREATSTKCETVDSVEKLVRDTLIILSQCDPPGRFLGMDLTTGRWRILNPIFAQLKTEQTYFECMKVTQHKMATVNDIRDALTQAESIGTGDEALLGMVTVAQTSETPCASLACSVLPCPTFGDIAAMQLQARQILRGTRMLGSAEILPPSMDTDGLSSLSTLPSQIGPIGNGLPLSSINAGLLLNTFPTNVHLMQLGNDMHGNFSLPISIVHSSPSSIPHGFQRSAEDVPRDMMDVVGGMLSLSKGARRRGSI